MPNASPAEVRAAIAARTPAPVYLLLGDDEAELATLTAGLSGLVEDELRAFNVERIYAGEKGATPAAIVEAAQMLPMMGDRRIVVALRAERFFKLKRKGRTVEEPEDGDAGAEPP